MVEYICSSCGTLIQVENNSNLRCSSCGCTVCYKKRTPNRISFLAR